MLNYNKVDCSHKTHTKGDEYNAEAAEVLTMSDASTRCEFCALAARENRKNSIFQDAMHSTWRTLQSTTLFCVQISFLFGKKDLAWREKEGGEK